MKFKAYISIRELSIRGKNRFGSFLHVACLCAYKCDFEFSNAMTNAFKCTNAFYFRAQLEMKQPGEANQFNAVKLIAAR